MIVRSWAKIFVTLGPIGYLKAPGSMATLASLPLVYLMGSLTLGQYTGILVALTFLAFIAVRIALPAFHTADPQAIVIDECVGTMITFWAIKISLATFIIGFVLFRLFDIVKPLGISKLERLPGSWGIMLDDITAGVIANILLQGYVAWLW